MCVRREKCAGRSLQKHQIKCHHREKILQRDAGSQVAGRQAETVPA